MAAPSGSPTVYIVLSVVFALFAGIRLLIPETVDVVQGLVSLGLCVGSGLFAWALRGGPAWAETASKGAYAVAIALALGDLVADLL